MTEALERLVAEETRTRLAQRYAKEHPLMHVASADDLPVDFGRIR